MSHFDPLVPPRGRDAIGRIVVNVLPVPIFCITGYATNAFASGGLVWWGIGASILALALCAVVVWITVAIDYQAASWVWIGLAMIVIGTAFWPLGGLFLAGGLGLAVVGAMLIWHTRQYNRGGPRRPASP